MYLQTLGFMFLLVSQMTFAQGRGPAVEDFVGVEVEETQGVPQGTESLFNFEKDIKKLEVEKKPVVTQQAGASIETAAPGMATAAMAILFIIGLPAMIWFMMMNHLRQKAHQEGASNIEVLEKYRRERQEAKKVQDEIKKAS